MQAFYLVLFKLNKPGHETATPNRQKEITPHSYCTFLLSNVKQKRGEEKPLTLNYLQHSIIKMH